ncbi:MAG: DUF1292 domain-containing protein [Firmicutes bacterium HGW-Firmicutes-2]|jgi:uncharacterized protein YrzB (UPF0473 family)|nr:MAG: DUF1292 domain-containing protein [Firmicutes bacterium HGW-Firmicutes-2]
MSEDNMKDLSSENCGDDCGCGHDHEDHHHDTITLTMENNEQVECAVLGIFEVEDQEYVALLPEDSEDVFIYIYKEDENGEIELENIESQEDFDKISAAFLEIMENEEEEEEV